jgi:hypothetical protein
METSTWPHRTGSNRMDKMIRIIRQKIGTKRYGPRAKGTALWNTVFGNGRGRPGWLHRVSTCHGVIAVGFVGNNRQPKLSLVRKETVSVQN